MRRLPVLLLLFLLLFQARSLHAQGTTEEEQQAWLSQHAHLLAVEAMGFEDLSFLAPLLEGKRIVQLGENTHGVREYNQLKARMVQYLHQELGYEVLVFESDLYQCYDAYLTAAKTSAMKTLTSCAYGTWHTKAVLPLFEYLRATQQQDRPLRLVGMDVQPIGNNKDDRPDFLAEAVAPFDATYAEEVRALDATFLMVYSRGGRERRAHFRSEEGQQMLAGYDQLAAFLAEREADTTSTAMRVARQTAATLAWYIRQQTAPSTQAYVEYRDQGMAENLMFILDVLYPDQKVIVWGHNFHLRHDNLAIPPDSTMFPNVAARTMGSWLHERYENEVYTVGVYGYEGTAMNNSGEVFEIEPAAPGSLEALLYREEADAVFVDVSQTPPSPQTGWMDQPVTARFNGTTALPIIVRDQYDAVLLVNRVTPRVMLY